MRMRRLRSAQRLNSDLIMVPALGALTFRYPKRGVRIFEPSMDLPTPCILLTRSKLKPTLIHGLETKVETQRSIVRRSCASGKTCSRYSSHREGSPCLGLISEGS